ncbi:MAG: WD40 repeat domain-containing protein [Acidimicrobiales bacterium]
MTDLRALLDTAADAVPANGPSRADRAVTTARRVRKTRVAAIAVAAVAAVVAGALMVPVASRLGTIEPAGPGDEPSVPGQIYPVPLHAPSVGEGPALGQPAAYLLGGVPRADGWFGESCCHLAVVGASTDEYAFLDLPGMTDVAGGGALNARLAPDGRVIAYATPGGIRLLNLVDGTSRTFDAPPGLHPWSVLAWSGDGSRLAVATGDPKAGATEEIGLATVTVADQPSWSTPDLGVEWDGSTNAVALAPDGAQITLAQDGELRIAPVDGGSARILLSGIGPVDPQVAWSPDGELIAALGFANRRDQSVAPAGSGAAWFKGRYVEVATGKPGLFDIERGYELTSMLGFSGDSHVLVLVSPSGGSGPYVLERNELTTTDWSIVTRLSDGIDGLQIDAAAALLDTGPRSSTQPHDFTRAIAPVAAITALAALVIVLVIGEFWRRRGLR